ncbi:MAG: DUF1801 domain-containing protein [Chloroflexota bacterium]
MAAKKTREKAAPRAASKGGDVKAYMRGLQQPRKNEMQAVRRIILGVSPKITEEIKWNAPSFALGEHFVTFNAWAKDCVQLIFHHGPKKSTSKGHPIEDPDGQLEWLATDRASITFRGMKDVREKKAALQSIVRQWIKAMRNPAAPADRAPAKPKGK